MTNDALTAKMTSPWDAPLEPAQIPSPLHPVHHPLLDAHGVPANQASAYAVLVDAKNNYGPRRDPVLLRRTFGGVLVPVQPVAIAGVSANKKSGLFKKVLA